MSAAPGVRLLGYERQPEATTFRAGDALRLTLLWQVQDPALARESELFLQLRQGDATWRRMQGHPLGGGIPEGAVPDEWLREEWESFLPAAAPGGRYTMELVAQSGGSLHPLLDLGTVEIEQRVRVEERPPIQYPQEATFEGQIALLGFDLPADPAPSAPLPLILHWQALGEVDQSYVRFVHLLDSAGQLVAQHDSPPGAGAFPTTSWVEGEFVSEVVPLVLPPDLPPGDYQLVVGLYEPQGGAQLLTEEGGSRVMLGALVTVR